MRPSRGGGPGVEDHVRVAVRVRPSVSGRSCCDTSRRNTVLLARSSHGAARRFAFDDVFEERTSNAELYGAIGQPLLRSALDGYNATLLAYGQTGAGKTHTIMGQGRDPGVVMRLVAELFAAAEQHEKHVQFSMLEIYNERIRDLFSVRPQADSNLKIREDPATGPFVEDLSWFVAENEEAMQQLLAIGAEARTMRSTHNNQHSSRAHTVVQIAITDRASAGAVPASSMICVVDLAGSERNDPTGSGATVSSAATKTLREGCSINQSLTNLGLCISALVAAGPSKAKRGGQSSRRLAALGLSPAAGRTAGSRGAGRQHHVPYRNSTLTWLLRESIGGNSKTAILACVNPEPRHREESLSTLRFADGAKQLTTHVDRNQGGSGGFGRAAKGALLREGFGLNPSDAQATIAALREEVRRLESTLQAAQQHSGGGAPSAGLSSEPGHVRVETGGKAPCAIAGGLTTALNGGDGQAAFQNGDRVTVWDPASQQEHVFLHLESTAPRPASSGSAAAVPEPAGGEEQGAADQSASLLGMDDSMVSFLQMEEMANDSRPRRHSFDSSFQQENDLGAEDEDQARTRRRKEKEAHKKRRQSRALKTSTSESADKRSARGGRSNEAVPSAGSSLGAAWAPCLIFVLGCGAALLPAGTEPPEADAEEVGVSAADTATSEPTVELEPDSISTPGVAWLAWVPSVIGVIGWCALAAVLFRRWRRWLAAQPQPEASDARPERARTTQTRTRVSSAAGERASKEDSARRRRRAAPPPERSAEARPAHSDPAVVSDAPRSTATKGRRKPPQRRRRPTEAPVENEAQQRRGGKKMLGDITNSGADAERASRTKSSKSVAPKDDEEKQRRRRRERELHRREERAAHAEWRDTCSDTGAV